MTSLTRHHWSLRRATFVLYLSAVIIIPKTIPFRVSQRRVSLRPVGMTAISLDTMIRNWHNQPRCYDYKGHLQDHRYSEVEKHCWGKRNCFLRYFDEDWLLDGKFLILSAELRFKIPLSPRLSDIQARGDLHVTSVSFVCSVQEDCHFLTANGKYFDSVPKRHNLPLL